LGEGVAEEKAVVQEVASSSPAPSGQKPVLFIILAIINMAVVAGVGFMVWQGKKKEAAEPKIEHVIKGEAETQATEVKQRKNSLGELYLLKHLLLIWREQRAVRLRK
jgi:flagellar FliL protein